MGCGWLQTLSGVRLPVDALGELLVIGGAVLVRPDIVGANGVLHGIDQVLLPSHARLSGAPWSDLVRPG